MSPITITKNNFDSEVVRPDKPVLVDCWAGWCAPCRMIAPVVEQIANEVPSVKVGKLNIDEQPELAGMFGVMSIPTLFLFKNGKLVGQMVGVRPKAAILDMIKSVQ